jgi:Leucine-rich repeat (LRR) protein
MLFRLLTFNSLTAIGPNAFVGMTALAQLDLSDNLISSLSPALLSPLTTLQTLCVFRLSSSFLVELVSLFL